ncbi:MAG: sigma-70 family RNA polymerase sigma factor [Chitinophagaceae bacterium]|nr:sigma-70 family RNA polymerase sigma factor [Chitinophagaceae bacterium]
MSNKFKHISDAELLENFSKDDDNKWLGILLERYTLLLFGVGMKYLKDEEEAKDVVQQVFLKAITELGKYKVDYFKSWIYMVAKNYCLMKLRDNPGKYRTPISENMNVMLPEEENEARISGMEKEKKLALLSLSLEELNPAQKQCITLFYIDKKSYQEITDQTGFTMMQVKSHIQNGKRNLKMLLDEKLNNS